jgi:hypothetical protein
VLGLIRFTSETTELDGFQCLPGVLTMTDFGWSYPPGCSGPPDDDYDDTVCYHCGKDLRPIEEEAGDQSDWPPHLEEGFCSQQCQEATSRGETYDPHALTKEQQDRLSDLSKRLAGIDRPIPTLTQEELFNNAPEGDFEWKMDDPGDMYATCCGEEDCEQQWHGAHYNETIGRRNGKLFAELYEGDTDGNWDCNCRWEEGEDFYEIADAMGEGRLYEYFRGWAEYWLDSAATGQDKLVQFYSEPDNWGDACLDAAEQQIKYLET